MFCKTPQSILQHLFWRRMQQHFIFILTPVCWTCALHQAIRNSNTTSKILQVCCIHREHLSLWKWWQNHYIEAVSAVSAALQDGQKGQGQNRSLQNNIKNHNYLEAINHSHECFWNSCPWVSHIKKKQQINNHLEFL